jgi:Icc protein
MMKRAAWVTDIHLNFLSAKQIVDFGKSLSAKDAIDCVLVTGDVSEYPTLMPNIVNFQHSAGVPVYFVMGNHDYYHGSVADVQRLAQSIGDATCGDITWMPSAGLVEATPDTCIIGHDGWYDCRAGSGRKDGFLMADWKYIEDFKRHLFYMPAIVGEAQSLAAQGTRYLEAQLLQAVERYKNIIVMTHVPPFPGASMHNGRMSDDYAIPFYCNLTLGEMLLEVMGQHPDRNMTVLAGHTHSFAHYRAAPNVECFVGTSEYLKPSLASLITFR